MATKIVMKTLKGDNFEVEVDPSITIQDLKKKVSEVRTEFPADHQKLIYSGRILTDDSTVAQAGVKPGEFVVVMVTKPKAATLAAPSPTAAPTPAPEPAPMPAPALTVGAGVPTNYGTAASNLVTGTGMSSAVSQLCEMGFERADVERCLRAAFNNPDRAVEYLMSGIPENALAPEDEAAPAPQAEGMTGATPPPAQTIGTAPFPAFATGGAEAGADGGAAALAELRNSPMFPELARLVTQNPQALAQMVPALAQSNPGLVQAILQNPEAFQQMLQEASGAQGESTDPVEAMLAAAGGEGGGAAGGGEPMVVELTDEQRQAVDRLCALGFDQDMCLQAYIFCDKNEDLAANFLFDSGNMDVED
jgi:UV excision repair protein RAD23